MSSDVQTARPLRNWITASAAAELAEMSRNAVPQFARTAGVRVRQIPGRHREYHRRDLLRALKRYVTTPAAG
jgi:hypothetical protein